MTENGLQGSSQKEPLTPFQLWKEGKYKTKDVLEELYFSEKWARLTLDDGEVVPALAECYTISK
ncbi:MAG: hypothetical protein FWD25_13840 [Clostridia bacterium]|nr:hypothetical protein [Clostridia bacterium]